MIKTHTTLLGYTCDQVGLVPVEVEKRMGSICDHTDKSYSILVDLNYMLRKTFDHVSDLEVPQLLWRMATGHPPTRSIETQVNEVHHDN